MNINPLLFSNCLLYIFFSILNCWDFQLTPDGDNFTAFHSEFGCPCFPCCTYTCHDNTCNDNYNKPEVAAHCTESLGIHLSPDFPP